MKSTSLSLSPCSRSRAGSTRTFRQFEGCKLRSLLLPVCAALVLVGHAAAADAVERKRWQFAVSLDGKPIGSHSFEVQDHGAQQTVKSEARFDVKFLFVTAFRYRHENTEIWSEGCLSRIDAMTDSNGRKLTVRGALEGDVFAVQSNDGREELPSCVQTFAYWNQQFLGSQKLLNSQTGIYEDVSMDLEGRDQVSVAGERVEALRYRLTAPVGDLTLWYSADDSTWLGLEAPAKGGRKLLYQAVDVPAAASRQLAARND